VITRNGPWQISFAPANASLTLQHDTGTVLNGTLGFQVGDASWRIDDPRDAVAERLALLDTQQNVQGYVHFVTQGSRLELLVHHRTAQSYSGTLAFEGTATLGETTFACRTSAPETSDVVQLCTGPADSSLNDTLFDIATDTALRFGGATVAITSGDAFEVSLTARVEDASASSLIFEVLPDYYRSRYVPYYAPIDKRRCPSPPTGWMSWNTYFDQAGAKENLDEARVGAEHLQPFGMEIWSMESWQGNSSKLPVSSFHNLDLSAHATQFPEGMKKLAEDIRSLGFTPGIWTAPFGTGNQEFYEAHKSMFLHKEDGEPFTNWCGRYLLDPSQPEVRDHMREMHRIMREEWGYEFFKIDGMSGRSQGYSAHFFERDEVKAAFRDDCPNPFELCVRAFREGIGPDSTFLACQGHYTGPEAEVADASRIGGDIVHPNKPSNWNNLLSQGRATLNQLFVNNIVFYNDPDTLLVGDHHAIEQARVTTTIVALPGQLTFAGDKLGELAPERMRLLQQCLPVCDARPLDLFPIFHMRPVWDLKVSRPFGDWDVVALFNWDDEDHEVATTIADLGLAPGSYTAWELWTSTDLGTVTDSVSMTVPARGVRIVALHALADHPQFLSTDRHVTQGAVSLQDCCWTRDALKVKVDLIGGHEFIYRFRVPEGYAFVEAQGDGVQANATQTGDVLAVALSAPVSGAFELVLAFSQ
jgi:hypothetical protein